MAITSPVSRRYAKAIVEAASRLPDRAAVEKTAVELESVAKLVHGSPELANVLSNPLFTGKDREKVVGAVFAKLQLSEQVRRFLTILIEQDRVGELEAIGKHVRRLADERAGRVRAEVQTAAPLDPTSLEALKRALEKRTGKTVDIHLTVDPTLLGGVRAQIGSIVLDGTIRSQLEALREGLLRE